MLRFIIFVIEDTIFLRVLKYFSHNIFHVLQNTFDNDIKQYLLDIFRAYFELLKIFFFVIFQMFKNTYCLKNISEYFQNIRQLFEYCFTAVNAEI